MRCKLRSTKDLRQFRRAVFMPGGVTNLQRSAGQRATAPPWRTRAKQLGGKTRPGIRLRKLWGEPLTCSYCSARYNLDTAELVRALTGLAKESALKLSDD